MASVPFSTICFRAAPRDLARLSEKSPKLKPEIDNYLDSLNEAVLNAVNSSGRVFLSHTRLRDRSVIRLAIGNIRTTENHASRAWAILRDCATRTDKELRPLVLRMQAL